MNHSVAVKLSGRRGRSLMLGVLVLLGTLLFAGESFSGEKKNLLSQHFWHDADADDVVEMLNSGASLSQQDEAGRTPLHIAAQYASSEEAVSVLLQNGADIEARDVHGWTPLARSAAFGSDPEILELLLEIGAQLSISIRDVLNISPLHWAVEFSKHPEMVEILLDHGADVSERDGLARTPLHFVAAWRSDDVAPEIVEILLERGADPKVEDVNGIRPLQLAMLIGQNRKVIRLLRAAEGEE